MNAFADTADKQPQAELSPDLQQERTWLAASCRDPEKFRFFYEKYAERIHRFIFRRTLDPVLTEDLVALTFTNALSHLGHFRWKGIAVGTWLFRIATNEIHKHVEKEKRLATVDGDIIQETARDPRRNQLTRMILTEDQSQLYECLHRLTQQDQDIFVLHYWEGLKTREIAEALDISENTVKTRLRRGRERLKELMSEAGEGSLAPMPPDKDWGIDPDLRFAKWAPPDHDGPDDDEPAK